MCKRESKQYDDNKEWHMQFYRNVTCNIDEEVFRPLFDENMGCPTKAIRQLVAMSILKEGAGCSDETLYESSRFNLLWRAALGLFNMDDQYPAISYYYHLCELICDYEETSAEHENLYEKCFQKLTAAQCKAYKVSGKTVRMNSKFISSNIAWYSRYEIIHRTLLKSVDKSAASRIPDQLVRLKAEDFLDEDASKTIYRSDSETLGKRLLDLGIVISHIIKVHAETDFALLRRVFHEQYDVAEDGTITVRDKKLIASDSVQNPNDTDATYRSKWGKKVKGFATNITETVCRRSLPEQGQP